MREGWRNSVLVFALAPALLLTGCVTVSTDGAAAVAVPRTAVASRADAQKRAGIHLQLASGYYGQRQFAVAVEEANLALAALPALADAYSVRALAYMAQGQSVLAERDFRHALQLTPDNPDFANNYGWFLCNDGDGSRVAAAMRYFDEAIANPAYRTPGKALSNAGVCSLKRGDVVAAERYFMNALRHEPGSQAVNVNLGKLYFDRDEIEKASFYLGQAAKNEVLMVDTLWLGIRIERKLGNQAAENDLAAQLRRRYPSSSEYAAYQRGAFDE